MSERLWHMITNANIAVGKEVHIYGYASQPAELEKRFKRDFFVMDVDPSYVPVATLTDSAPPETDASKQGSSKTQLVFHDGLSLKWRQYVPENKIKDIKASTLASAHKYTEALPTGTEFKAGAEGYVFNTMTDHMYKLEENAKVDEVLPPRNPVLNEKDYTASFDCLVQVEGEQESEPLTQTWNLLDRSFSIVQKDNGIRAHSKYSTVTGSWENHIH